MKTTISTAQTPWKLKSLNYKIEIITSVKSKEENVEYGGSPLIHSINCIEFKKMTLQNVTNISAIHPTKNQPLHSNYAVFPIPI